MNTSTYSVFASQGRAPTGHLVRLEVTSPTFGPDEDGAHRALTVGEVLELEHDPAKELITSGRVRFIALVDRATGKEVPLTGLEKFAPEDFPEAVEEFADLPELFRQWAKAYREVGSLQRHLQRLEAHRSKLEIMMAMDRTEGGTRAQRMGYRATVDAIERAKAALDAIDPSKFKKLVRECNAKAMDAVAVLNGKIRELHATALKIFTVRVSPLDLHAEKIEQLARGSSAYSRYVFPQPEQGLVSPCWGRGTRGEQIVYCELGPLQMANLFQLAERRRAEVETLLAAAKKELAAVQKLFPVPVPA
jgi:hypothetical protein